jgi:hypothetical protein
MLHGSPEAVSAAQVVPLNDAEVILPPPTVVPRRVALHGTETAAVDTVIVPLARNAVFTGTNLKAAAGLAKPSVANPRAATEMSFFMMGLLLKSWVCMTPYHETGTIRLSSAQFDFSGD